MERKAEQPVTKHPLVNFIYSTIGKPFGDLLLAGYGSERGEKRVTFKIPGHAGSHGVTWAVDVVTDSPPRGREPLVLAALLKFLLLRIELDDEWNVTPDLEFNMGDLLDEVGRDGVVMTAEEVDAVIKKYVNTSYHSSVSKMPEGVTSPEVREKGRYTLLSGHTVLGYSEEGDDKVRRLVNRVAVHPDFVKGLKRGEINFAGLNLGRVNPPITTR